MTAASAAGIVLHSGVGNFNRFELEDYLSRAGMEVTPFIYYDEVGISGMSKSQDTETLLKLVYLYYTSPNVSKYAYLDWKSKERVCYIEVLATLQSSFLTKRLVRTICSYGIQKGQKTLDDLEKISF